MGNLLRSWVEKIDKLPTLPVVAREILKMAGDPYISLDTIKEIVTSDPAITAKILGVANSPFFRSSERTVRLDDAIMRIGFNNLKSIALGISVLTLLGDNQKTSDYKRLFDHSLSVGLSVQSIAKKLRMRDTEDIMTEGLLHDLGYLVLNKYFPDIYGQVLENFGSGQSVLDSERATFHHTHAEVGSWLADAWQLPETITDINRFHHTPSLAQRSTERVAIVHIADYIVTKNIFSPLRRDPGYPLDYGCFEILKISDSALEELERSTLALFNKGNVA